MYFSCNKGAENKQKTQIIIKHKTKRECFQFNTDLSIKPKWMGGSTGWPWSALKEPGSKQEQPKPGDYNNRTKRIETDGRTLQLNSEWTHRRNQQKNHFIRDLQTFSLIKGLQSNGKDVVVKVVFHIIPGSKLERVFNSPCVCVVFASGTGREWRYTLSGLLHSGFFRVISPMI